MTHAIAKIQTVKTAEGFKVYGRLGAVLVADEARNVTYSNMNKSAPEYTRMESALKAFKS